MEKKSFPEVIEGDLIILKKHKPELAELMFRYVDKDRERLRIFLPWVDSTKTVQDEVSYISVALEKWNDFELFDYGIFRKADDCYMGNVGVHSIVWQHDRCELGYWILGEYEGQGFISEAVTYLEQFCFSFGFHRVEIRCSSQNIRSARVPTKNGYRLEGYFQGDAVELGEYRNTLVFAKTKSRERAPIFQLEDVAIRKAEVSDAAEIANVHVNSWRESYRGLLDNFYLEELPLTFRRRMSFWDHLLKTSLSSEVHVAESKQGLVGFCAAQPARDQDMAGYAEIGAIYLLNGFKKKGMGFQLLKYALRAMKNRGFAKAYCWMLKDNPAGQFYERSGARRDSTKLKNVDLGQKAFEEVMYRWETLDCF